MINCLSDMRCKEVVSVCDGRCLGCVDDLKIDTCCAKIMAIVIYGRPKCFGLLGREDDIVIPWSEIKLIGEDTILVDYKCCVKNSHRLFFDFFRK